MKRLSAVLFAVVTVGLHAAPFISIGDLKFHLTYTGTDQRRQWRNYLPLGEDIGHYNRLLTVEVFKERNDPEAYLLELAALVTKSAHTARYQYLRNDQTGELVLDCLIPRPASLKEGFAEWSLMRAKVVEGVGLVVTTYVMRIYGVERETGSLIERERIKVIAPFSAASFVEERAPNQGLRPSGQ